MPGTDIVNHQKGFSIIEMMLAFVMGLIVAEQCFTVDGEQ